MNYWVSDVPLINDEGEANGKTESLVCAYSARQGLSSAAFAVTALLHAFPTVDHVILCGVAAGVPTPPPTREEWEKSLPDRTDTEGRWKRLLYKHGETDVRLGDVVVGEAAVQFDFGRKAMNGFTPRGEPVRGCEQLKTVSDRLYERMKSEGARPWDRYIDEALEFVSKNRSEPVRRPPNDELKRYRLDRDPSTDDLVIVAGEGCLERGVPAHKVPVGRPNLFRAKVGSSDMVMKDSLERDKIGVHHRVGVLEMEGCAALEAAAAFKDCRAIIIRGVCDYADPDKNDDWWMYSAIAAAAYTRCLIERLHLQLDS